MRRLVVPLVAALGLGVVVAAVVAAFLVLEDRRPTTVVDARERTCEPSAERPGPLLDLGVQAATGDPDDPLLPATRVDELVGLAADAGADVISTDVSWESVQPTRGSDLLLGGLDLVLEAAEARGLAVRVQLTESPAWAVAPAGEAGTWAPPTTRAELARWRAFVAATLRHLDGRADYVEIWNEPDEPTAWGGEPDPAAFARLLRATAPVVRRLAPEAVLVSGGLAGNDVGYLELLYEALGDSRPFDLVGVHPFSGALPPLALPPTELAEGRFGPYDASFLGYRELHDVMTARGDGDRGLYLGEFGYSTRSIDGRLATSDALRATYVEQALGAVTCTPYVVALGWYYLHPTTWDDASWTLLDEELRPSRTYDALAAWTRDRVS